MDFTSIDISGIDDCEVGGDAIQLGSERGSFFADLVEFEDSTSRVQGQKARSAQKNLLKSIGYESYIFLP